MQWLLYLATKAVDTGHAITNMTKFPQVHSIFWYFQQTKFKPRNLDDDADDIAKELRPWETCESKGLCCIQVAELIMATDSDS